MRKTITITTVPNGYNLHVNGKDYMAFSETDLLAAVFTHVALGIKDYADRDISKNLMLAASRWTDLKDVMQSNAELQSKVGELREEVRRLNRIINERQKMTLDRYGVLSTKKKSL